MTIKQVSVFIENKQGRLAAIVEQLAANDVDISALSLADSSEFGVLRLIVNKTNEAKKVLNDSGVIVKITEVLAIAMDDIPGGAAAAIRLFSDNGIMVDYMYACIGRVSGKALMIVKVDAPEQAQKLLDDAGFGAVSPADIYRI